MVSVEKARDLKNTTKVMKKEKKAEFVQSSFVKIPRFFMSAI